MGRAERQFHRGFKQSVRDARQLSADRENAAVAAARPLAAQLQPHVEAFLRAEAANNYQSGQINQLPAGPFRMVVRRLCWHVATRRHGDGDYSPEDKIYLLADGRLFLWGPRSRYVTLHDLDEEMLRKIADKVGAQLT